MALKAKRRPQIVSVAMSGPPLYLWNDSHGPDPSNYTWEFPDFSDVVPDYDDNLQSYEDFYSGIHGYISIVVCTLGILGNFINMFVLKRKKMISPINIILTGLAVADAILLALYVPICYAEFLNKNPYSENILLSDNETGSFRIQNLTYRRKNGINFDYNWNITDGSGNRNKSYDKFSQNYGPLLMSLEKQIPAHDGSVSSDFQPLINLSQSSTSYEDNYSYYGSPPPTISDYNVSYEDNYYYYGSPPPTISDYNVSYKDIGESYRHIIPSSSKEVSSSDIILVLQLSWVVIHMISVWLTVVAAIWRFISVCYPTYTKPHLSKCRAKLAIILTCIACALFNIPEFLRHTVYKYSFFDPEMHSLGGASMVTTKNGLLAEINVWLFVIFSKIIPCIFLTGISIFLVKVLYEAKQRREKLNAKNSSNKTTKMLLAIMVFFLVTHLPYGIIFLLSEALDVKYFRQISKAFSDTADFLALLNSSVNVVIYYLMSSQFREACSWSNFREWWKDKKQFSSIRETTLTYSH